MRKPEILIGLDPGLTAGAVVALVDGLLEACIAWEPTRATQYEAQATASALMLSQFPEARLVFEKPHKQRGRSISTYGSLSRSIGIWLGAYPRRSAGATPSEWRSGLGIPTRADDIKMESLVACAEWIFATPEADPHDLLKNAIGAENDHVCEAALIARWWRMTKGRGKKR